MNGNSTPRVSVDADGKGVVAHVGLHASGAFADRLGVGDCLSPVVPWTGEPAPGHERGKVLTQAMLMLAGGGEAFSDIEALRCQSTLFGSVPSAPTLSRTIRNELTPTVVADLRDAFTEVIPSIWARSAATTGNDAVVLDIDASLVAAHSENKAGTAATYKGGFPSLDLKEVVTAMSGVSPHPDRQGSLGGPSADGIGWLRPAGHPSRRSSSPARRWQRRDHLGRRLVGRDRRRPGYRRAVTRLWNNRGGDERPNEPPQPNHWASRSSRTNATGPGSARAMFASVKSTLLIVLALAPVLSGCSRDDKAVSTAEKKQANEVTSGSTGRIPAPEYGTVESADAFGDGVVTVLYGQAGLERTFQISVDGRWADVPAPPFKSPIAAASVHGTAEGFVAIAVTCELDAEKSKQDSELDPSDDLSLPCVARHLEAAAYAAATQSWGSPTDLGLALHASAGAQTVDFPPSRGPFALVRVSDQKTLSAQIIAVDGIAKSSGSVTLGVLDQACSTDQGLVVIRGDASVASGISGEAQPARIEAELFEVTGDGESLPSRGVVSTNLGGAAVLGVRSACTAKTVVLVPLPKREFTGATATDKKEPLKPVSTSIPLWVVDFAAGTASPHGEVAAGGTVVQANKPVLIQPDGTSLLVAEDGSASQSSVDFSNCRPLPSAKQNLCLAQ